MAHTKAIGSTQLGRDSRPQFRGLKLHDGEIAKNGNIIVRQTGSSVIAGTGVRTGSDYTLYAVKDGLVKYTTRKKVTFDGATRTVKIVSIEAGPRS